MELDEAKRAVLETAREMDRTGLTEGTAGNVSARTCTNEVVLTPTAMAYDRMTVGDLVVTGPTLTNVNDFRAILVLH